jgi:hypothetical protein
MRWRSGKKNPQKGNFLSFARTMRLPFWRTGVPPWRDRGSELTQMKRHRAGIWDGAENDTLPQ